MLDRSSRAYEQQKEIFPVVTGLKENTRVRRRKICAEDAAKV